MSFLFHDIVFGPVNSRRLGVSLGINLLPAEAKFCTFNCVYCECGWTQDKLPGDNKLPSRELVRERLEEKLKWMKETGMRPDAITFAGNGEPTLHPDFPGIVDDALVLRDQYTPQAQVAILSNASMTHDQKVFNALLKLDQNIQKLDSGSEKLFRLINNPLQPGRFREMIEDLRKFNGQVIIQSLFLKGYFNELPVNNATAEELSEWLKHIAFIRPKTVMLYSIDRATPAHHLEKIPLSELEKIAEKVRKLNIRAVVY